MNKKTVITLSVLIILPIFIFIQSREGSAKAKGIINITEKEKIFVDITNKDRIANGKKPLVISEVLMLSADSKNQDMIDDGYFDHFSPDGTTSWHFIRSAGYRYLYAGENLANNYSTLAGAEKGFMNSNIHRKVILSDRYTEIGVSVMKLNNKYIITVHFGRPLY